MYCQRCGKEINDHSVFCRYCGTETENETNQISPTVTATQNNEYNKDILKLYLFQLRNLECAKHKLEKEIEDTDEHIASLGHSQLGYPPGENSSSAFGEVFAGIAFGVGILVAGWLLNKVGEWLFKSSFIMILAIIAAVIVFVFGVVSGISAAADNSKKEQEYELEKENDEKRVESELLEKDRMSLVRKNMDIEIEQANTLLDKAYSINIIPSQFRNLHAIYYLYDFLSTSNETLTSGLMHCDLDVIKQKLDTVIEQQQTTILNQAIIMAQNEQMIKQNDEQLKHIISAERNAEKAATYAQIASVNAETSAWIGVADYIKTIDDT